MNRLVQRLLFFVCVGLFAYFVFFVARNTAWVDTEIPMPLKGEALRNSFYAAQRFSEALGARTSRDRVLTLPPRNGVIVLSSWHWSLTRTRREAIEGWVESGGRLVIDASVAFGDNEFERWSGITRAYKDEDEEGEKEGNDETDDAAEEFERCRGFEESSSKAATQAPPTLYTLCDAGMFSALETKKPVLWSLHDNSGIQAMRVNVGRGTVTAINASPFQYRNFLEGHHPWVFAAATQVRRGDEVHFLTEDDHPSLFALLWQYGSPVVILTVAVVGLALWRGGLRFGPLVAAPQTARRSLAEQIRGTGQFALRNAGGEALHAAAVRALEETARRRIPRYARLSEEERGTALAGLTGIAAESLTAAMYHPRLQRSHDLRSAIALIEAARRLALHEQAKGAHATT